MTDLNAGSAAFPQGLDGKGRKEREGSMMISCFPLSN